MKKYYIEVYDQERGFAILQSKWYDTEAQAQAYADGIEYISDRVSVDLMESEWDTAEDSYTDITLNKRIK